MQINTTSLATLKAFTQFTARATVKESDIAKIDTTRAPSKSLRITTAKGDRAWWALSRTATSRADNNEVRTAFKKAVSDIFGGEDKIPDSVKKQMKLSDYGKGRPLTARRITAVTTAIVDLLRNQSGITDQNGKTLGVGDVMRDMGVGEGMRKAHVALRSSLESKVPISQCGLPEEYATELRSVFNDIHTRFFGKLPATEPTPRDFVESGLAIAIDPVIKNANSEGRSVTVDEIMSVIKPIYERGAAAECLRGVVEDLAKEAGVDGVNIHTIKKRHPEIIDDLMKCTSTEDLKSRIEGHKATLKDTMRLIGEIRKLENDFVPMIQNAIEEGVGQEGFKAKLGTTAALEFKFSLFTSSILHKENEDAKKPGWNLQDAVMQKVNNIAGGFISRIKEIDKCAENGEISPSLANVWKDLLLVTGRSNSFVPEKIVTAAKKLDGKELLAALAPSNDANAVLAGLEKFANKLVDVAKDALGGDLKWRMGGVDEREPVKQTIIDVVIEKTPGLKEALGARRAEMQELMFTISKDPQKTQETDERNIFADLLFLRNNFEYLGLKADAAK